MFEKEKDQSFPEREEEMLGFWRNQNIFDKSLKNRETAPYFSFYDGPPFATGLPHYGHLLAGTIKDVVPRFMTMKGYYVPRRFGWDCHGLPVENEIEKAHNLTGAKSIEEYGIDRFNEECRSIVLRYTSEWKATVERMGRWVDFNQTYRTMDLNFMESVWWVFKQLWEKGLVYEGHKVMPFSWKLGTPLSNFEATQNYQEIDSPSVVVAFQDENAPDTSYLAWTTTPWTLISNLALTVGPEVDYVKVAFEGKKYVLAKERVEAWFKEGYEIVENLKGKDLVGKTYKPLLPFFEGEKEKGAFRIIEADFVTTEEGTGIVHTAPAFGEDDFYACKNHGIAMVCPVDANGCFTEEVSDFVGQFVHDAHKEILKRLKEEGKLFYRGTTRHRYPFCWRSDTPLIYRAMNTWFVGVEQIKEALLKNNEEIHWTPGHIKEGRFGKWLEGARDWAISRNRYWGTPIPIWRADDGETHVIGSLDELEQLTGHRADDLHRHFIDALTFEKNGKTFRRISEVFDCWFESGSMPYAQNHYPFENKESVENHFPADFIAEGLDQTRGWFYTLHILAAALFDKPAFKNVIVNGIILAENGAKMSKRLKNYPDPTKMLNKYGADAIRLYMLHSNAVKGDDLCFSEAGVELVLRQVMIPLWNAYSFFITYARICSWKPQEAEIKKPKAEIDRWVLSKLHHLIDQVEKGMGEYDLSRAVEPFIGFIDQLTNWYIRRCRRRFWSEEATQDREEAFATLYHVLLTLSQIIAPFIPFNSEAIFCNLRSDAMPESVHLCDFPKCDSAFRNDALEEKMELIQKVVWLGHSLRKKNKVKVRQPLPKIRVASGSYIHLIRDKDSQDLIKEELNVKDLELVEDEQDLVELKAKPNFRKMGPKVGKKMPLLQKAIGAIAYADLQRVLNGGVITLDLDGDSLELNGEDLEVQRIVKEGSSKGRFSVDNDGETTVALDLNVTPELEEEGLYREIVNKINTMRRDAKFEVTDRIHVVIEKTPKVASCFEKFGDLIQKEVLALSFELGENQGAAWDLNGEDVKIFIEKTMKNLKPSQ